jgi:hypothetical protein
VDIGVFARTPRGDRVRGIGDIQHVETSLAWEIPRGTDSVDHVGLLMANNVVGAANIGVPSCEVAISGENLGATRLDLEELNRDSSDIVLFWIGHIRLCKTYLSHIKDLDSVVCSLGTNVDVAINDLHVTPNAILGLRRETADILNLSLLNDFDERGAVGLPNGSKFTAIRGCPTCVSLESLE